MNTLTIQTNHQFREILYWYELTESEQADFDYLESDEDKYNASFFRYRKQVYNLSEFMRIQHNEELKGWDGYSSDSYFSGVLVKYSECGDGVKVSTYYS